MTGLTESEARSDLQDKGFTNIVSKPVVSDRDPGTVAEQDPKANSKKTKNTKITLSIAQASPKVGVPDVTGQDAAAAEQQLKAQGFEVTKTEQEVTDPNQVGKVLSQSPEGNTKAKANSTVNLTVGKAGAQTPVPSVVGQTVKDAKKALQQAGFKNIQFAGGSSTDDNARVVTQDPAAQTPSDPANTTVTLTTIGGGGGGNGNGGNDGGGGIFGGPFGG